MTFLAGIFCFYLLVKLVGIYFDKQMDRQWEDQRQKAKLKEKGE